MANASYIHTVFGQFGHGGGTLLHFDYCRVRSRAQFASTECESPSSDGG